MAPKPILLIYSFIWSALTIVPRECISVSHHNIRLASTGGITSALYLIKSTPRRFTHGSFITSLCMWSSSARCEALLKVLMTPRFASFQQMHCPIIDVPLLSTDCSVYLDLFSLWTSSQRVYSTPFLHSNL